MTLAKSGIGMKGGVSQFKFTSARNTVNSAVDCDNHLSSKVRNILIRKWGIEANEFKRNRPTDRAIQDSIYHHKKAFFDAAS
jgi:hypothetical protein